MARPRQLIQARVIVLATCFLVFVRSSSAPDVPPLPPPSAPDMPPLPPPAPPGTGILCVPHERDALLTFKAGLTDPTSYLSSWRSEDDCCRWMGVECSNRTGHVIKLEIHSYGTPYGTFMKRAIGGSISSSLLTLRHLKHLDLSWNNFGGKPIPEFIGGLGSLTDLVLTRSSFGGRIPPHLGNLSNLITLDLSYQLESCYSPDLAWVSNLRNLRYLSMSGMELRAAIDWTHAVNMLPSLVTLELVSCGLQNTMAPPLHSNLTSLESIYLNFNSFNSSFGANSLIWDLPIARYLSLFGCGIQGPIPAAVGNLTSIQSLFLDGNNFSGMVPSTFKKLQRLQVLELSENSISGNIQDLLHILPANELQELHLDDNSFTGSIPAQLHQFRSLSTLGLGNNKISGELPVGIRELTSLKNLRLFSNDLHGTITEDHFMNLTSLQVMWISDNSLTILVGNAWNAPFKLISAGFRSCILGPQFPAWISQPTIQYLDISNTSIHDSIPSEFWSTMQHAQDLDLSGNGIVGTLPTVSMFGTPAGQLWLDVSSNKLVGLIPTLPENLIYLDLSGNNLSGALPPDIGAPALEELVLFKNSFSGTIPCSLFQLQHLRFLDLSENLLSGTLPDCPRAPKASNIFMLMLNNNKLSGEFPSFLRRCKEISFLDLSHNKFSGRLPTWIGSKLPYLAFLRLRSNMFSGGIPVEITTMKELQYLDIAHNNISGKIPPSLGNLIAMAHTHDEIYGISIKGGPIPLYNYEYSDDSFLVVTKGQQLAYTRGIEYMINIDLSCNSLTGKIPREIGMLLELKSFNMSRNHLSGIIPQSIGELRAVESLDLSYNDLSGEIPTSLSDLTSLAYLNLSYNNLTGTIPSGNQLRALDDQASIYIGNPGLCGPPVSRNCSGTGTTPQPPQDQHRGMSDVLSLYLGIGTGFVAGLWVVFCGFLFKRNWRIRCFLLSDCVYDWVYAQVALSWASVARRNQ